MRFMRTTGWEDGLADLLQRLVKELAAGRKLVWIVSGGSNIPLSAQIMDNIQPALRRHLTVILGDERFGPVDHADSNCLQLRQAGFNTEHATAYRTLQAGLNLEQTTEHYRDIVQTAFAGADSIIAQLGIGADGHIAGILPDSPASLVPDALVFGYHGKLHDRITLGFGGLKRVTAAYVFAFGQPKRQALSDLRTKKLPLSRQPAQILKLLPEAYIYNDQIGASA